ncbi:MAG: NAD(P)/FAD-dependent oxidoreductase [Proteobacteria bacterium]|nr:NAD(P)/FAD-dependent oxidoreductase [Pseudomonadota bacterium]
MKYDSIIIGAGAAGLYCALHAGRRGRRVLVLEHNAEPGAKILISGGGRCNFTNINAGDPTRYISANPHFARSALTRHPPSEFIALTTKHRIAHYEKTLGQLFCEGARASQKIVRMLLDECAQAGVDIKLNCRVRAVQRGERFDVDTSLGAFTAETCIIATGGLSIPKLGATAFAYDIAKQFAVPIVKTRPALVPLTFSEADLAWMRPLSGVSAPVVASCGGASFKEAALFTHRGLSGPAILQASSYWTVEEDIRLDWLPDAADDVFAARKRERPRAQMKTILAEHMSERLATALSQRLPEGAIGDIKDATLIEAARTLKAWRLTPSGTEGYAKAEVTVGGIDTNALSQQTMEARAVRGLFFVGEAVDVTGWLGGYNFQWAWSSGWAAGQSC